MADGDGAASYGREAHGAPAAVVRVDVLRKFVEVVTELGGEPNALLARFQTSPAVLDNRHAVIPYRTFVRLLERAAEETGRLDFGMRLATAQGGAKVLGPLAVAMRNSRTMREAFGYCARHMQAFSTGTQIRIEEEQASVFLRFEILSPRLPYHPQTVEHALLLTQHHVLDLSGGRVRAREIWFDHEPISAPGAYRENFGATVRFGQNRNGALFARRDFDLPIPEIDPQLFELATHFIEQRYPATEPALSARVRSTIERLLLEGDCSYVKAASSLGLHPRTLQRRLRAESQTFEAIKDDVRRDVALRYLKQKNVPLIRIAALLGYSETSVLSRNCFRWFSASPRQLRGGAWTDQDGVADRGA
jgi:AraC-like DNA-binding protein